MLVGDWCLKMREISPKLPNMGKWWYPIHLPTSSDAGTEMLQVVDSFPPPKQTIIWYATGKPRKIQEQWFEMVWVTVSLVSMFIDFKGRFLSQGIPFSRHHGFQYWLRYWLNWLSPWSSMTAWFGGTPTEETSIFIPRLLSWVWWLALPSQPSWQHCLARQASHRRGRCSLESGSEKKIIPSGKLTVCYGKSPSLIGKSTINDHVQ